MTQQKQTHETLAAVPWTWRSLVNCHMRRVNPSKHFHNLFDEEVIMLLAFVGGFVDAAGYIKFDELFTSSITGNMVAACASIYKVRGVLARAMVCISFGIGGSLAVAAALKWKLHFHWKARHISMAMFVFEIALLVVTMVLGLVYEEEISSSIQGWSLILVSSIMGASMGVHNASARESIANCPATTVMTMTLVTLAGHFSNTLSYFFAQRGLWGLQNPYPEAADEAAMKKYFESMSAKHIDAEHKMETTFRPMLFFLIGALVGTAITWNGSYWSIFVPIAVIAALVADLYAAQLAEDLHTQQRQLKQVEYALELIEAQTQELTHAHNNNNNNNIEDSTVQLTDIQTDSLTEPMVVK